MKREINYKEHTTEAVAFVAFAEHLERNTEAAARVAAAQMIKRVCRLRLVDYKKIRKSDYDDFIRMCERDGLYVYKLYCEIIGLRKISITLHQPKASYLTQAERIFSSVLDHAGRHIIRKEVQDIELSLAKLHYAVEKIKEDESKISSLTLY